MHIGFDAKRLFHNYTGLGNYSRSVLSGLIRYFPENKYSLYTPTISSNSETSEIAHNPSVSVIKSDAIFKSYWRSFGIASHLKADKIDLFHGLSNEIPKRLRTHKIPSIVTIHDLIFKPFPETYPFFDRQIYDLKFRFACKNADHIIAISESTKNDIISHYKIANDKISVVYQSCNPLFFNDLRPEAISSFRELNLPSEYLLYVGSVIERKNLLTLLQAYREIPANQRIPLVIVGKGKEYRKKTEAFIRENKLENIRWLDQLENNAVLQAIYQHASAFIYPSRYEGFGIPIIEAALSRVPVIAANSSSLPEAGGPHSMYFNADDSEELASKITEVLHNQALRTKMMEGGFQYAMENFNLQTTSKALMEVYRRVAK